MITGSMFLSASQLRSIMMMPQYARDWSALARAADSKIDMTEV